MRLKYMIVVFCLLMTLNTIMPASCLRVDGAILKTDVAPGDHIRHEMQVRIGEDEQPIDAKAEIMGFGTNQYGVPDLIEPGDDKSLYSAREFFNISPESFHLEPGIPVTVVLEGDVPNDVGSGGRYALINIHTAPQGEGTVGYAAAIMVPIYLTINGTDLVKTGEITGINVSDTNALSISFENTGNCHYGVSAKALLKDENGNIVKNGSTSFITAMPTIPFKFEIPLNSEGNISTGAYAVEASVIMKDGTVIDKKEDTIEI